MMNKCITPTVMKKKKNIIFSRLPLLKVIFLPHHDALQRVHHLSLMLLRTVTPCGLASSWFATNWTWWGLADDLLIWKYWMEFLTLRMKKPFFL